MTAQTALFYEASEWSWGFNINSTQVWIGKPAKISVYLLICLRYLKILGWIWQTISMISVVAVAIFLKSLLARSHWSTSCIHMKVFHIIYDGFALVFFKIKDFQISIIAWILDTDLELL